MKVTVKLFATLRKHAHDSEKGLCYVDLNEGSTVDCVLKLLNIPEGIPKIILINGQQKCRDDRLNENDTLSIFPPIAGG